MNFLWVNVAFYDPSTSFMTSLFELTDTHILLNLYLLALKIMKFNKSDLKIIKSPSV